MFSPMSIIVVLGGLIAAAVGTILIVRTLRGAGRLGERQQQARLGKQLSCPHCALLNPASAKFCGHCGRSL
jgi:hypothetical protein